MARAWSDAILGVRTTRRRADSLLILVRGCERRSIGIKYLAPVWIARQPRIDLRLGELAPALCFGPVELGHGVAAQLDDFVVLVARDFFAINAPDALRQVVAGVL